jgi:hypothetical protein
MEGISSLGPVNNGPEELSKYAKRIKYLILGTGSLWNAGTTFRNACDISVLYVTGLLPNSPYHYGPITSESNALTYKLAQCTRNGLLTTSSEPVQSGDMNVITGEYVSVSNASIEFWIKKHNSIIMLKTLRERKYSNRFNIEEIKDAYFSELFGPSYDIENDHVTRYFIIDTLQGTNEIFDILKNISSQFTEYPSQQ